MGVSTFRDDRITSITRPHRSCMDRERLLMQFLILGYDIVGWVWRCFDLLGVLICLSTLGGLPMRPFVR